MSKAKSAPQGRRSAAEYSGRSAGRENDDAVDSNDADIAEEIDIDDAEDCVWSRDSSLLHIFNSCKNLEVFALCSDDETDQGVHSCT